MVFGIFSTTNILAQDKPKEIPVKASTVEQAPAKTIFDYKADLQLTDKQVEDLQKTVSDLQNYIKEKKTQLETQGQDLIKMIQEKADLKLIRKKLDDIAKLQVDISYTDIESSRKVENILKPEQIEKWKKIQEDYRVKIQAEANKQQTEKK